MQDFGSNVATYKSMFDKQQQWFDLISTLRLLVFLLAAALAAICYWQGYFIYGFLVLLLGAALFGLLIMRHNAIERQKKRLACMMAINQQYLARVNGEWISFSGHISGEEYIDAKHPYASDLDIFGPKSLFQWMNVTNTFYGRKILQELLSGALPAERDVMQKRQLAVQELIDKQDFCQKLQCEGMLTTGLAQNPQAFLTYMENCEMFINSTWLIKLLYIWPVLVIISILLCFTALIPLYISYVLLIMNLGIVMIGYRKVTEIVSALDKLKRNITVYQGLIETINKERFTASFLNELKATLNSADHAAFQAINKLGSIADALEIRNSPILYFLLNALFLWDYHCILALEAWRKCYGNHVRKWLETIGYFEACASMTVIAQVNTEWCFPIFVPDGLKFSAKGLGHPLITERQRVGNDCDFPHHLSIITGSNMSGKTTFLRTIGISLVLAYAGAPVCAKSLACSIVKICTSMRNNDDLHSGISTFYAELLRIKTIIEYAHQKVPMLVLIDEIFRGTNSQDRIIGARNVLIHLYKTWIITLISTHDLELCNLAQRGMAITFYHFKESYLNDQLKFDYRLHFGCCATTNAQYLMKMVGIDILE